MKYETITKEPVSYTHLGRARREDESLGMARRHARLPDRPGTDVYKRQLRIRDGLGLTNGTAVMTGIGMVNLAQARRLLDWAVKASVMLNEDN